MVCENENLQLKVKYIYGGMVMWKHGEYNGFSWCIKVFDEGSRFGISNGKISKLWIQRKKNKEESFIVRNK